MICIEITAWPKRTIIFSEVFLSNRLVHLFVFFEIFNILLLSTEFVEYVFYFAIDFIDIDHSLLRNCFDLFRSNIWTDWFIPTSSICIFVFFFVTNDTESALMKIIFDLRVIMMIVMSDGIPKTWYLFWNSALKIPFLSRLLPIIFAFLLVRSFSERLYFVWILICGLTIDSSMLPVSVYIVKMRSIDCKVSPIWVCMPFLAILHSFLLIKITANTVSDLIYTLIS